MSILITKVSQILSKYEDIAIQTTPFEIPEEGNDLLSLAGEDDFEDIDFGNDEDSNDDIDSLGLGSNTYSLQLTFDADDIERVKLSNEDYKALQVCDKAIKRYVLKLCGAIKKVLRYSFETKEEWRPLLPKCETAYLDARLLLEKFVSYCVVSPEDVPIYPTKENMFKRKRDAESQQIPPSKKKRII